METDIRKSNKIPGYSQLTRPEEIAALSKYLGELKKDPYIDLEKNSLEVPGKDTPQVPKINELPEEQLRLSVQDQAKLDDTKIELKDDKRVELSGEKVNLNPAKNPRLISQTRKLVDNRDIRLEVKSERLAGENVEVELEKTPEKLKKTPEEPKLETETERLKAGKWTGGNLSDYIDSLNPENSDPNLSESVYMVSGDVDKVSSLYDSVLATSPNQNPVPEELEDQREGLNTTPGPDDLENTIIGNNTEEGPDALEDHKETIDPEELDDLRQSRNEELRAIIQDANNRLDEEGLYELALQLLHENEGSEWAERIASLMSAYLSGSRITPERADEYEERLLGSFIVPLQQQTEETELSEEKEELARNENGEPENLPDGVMGMTENNNPEINSLGENYTRVPFYWSGLGTVLQNGVSGVLRKTAEEILGPMVKGSLRATLINETLGLLIEAREQTEKALKINKDRLPGDSGSIVHKAIAEGLGGALGNLGFTSWDWKSGIGSLANNMIRGVTKKGLEVAASVKSGNSEYKGINSPSPLRRPVESKNNRGMEYGEEVNKTFNEFEPGTGYLRYFGGYYSQKPTGLNLTLQDLCDTKVVDVGTADKLLEILEKSPYITTAGKVNKGITRTLDSNMYWEVLMEPWVNDGSIVFEAVNGGYSFLPSPREINTINLVEHGVKTEYNKWIPLSGFELQKSKLTTKSLGLFDGEINYPVTSEYTNEFRMSVVDDQWKSWKHYFQKCADVSVYNSESHQADYYYEPDPIPTAVDKETMCAAFYKNITFLISVYVMTPQYFTARAFYLLCVLKDFSEDYTGEVDSGGADLNVSFSIVGELEEKPITSKYNLPITRRPEFLITSEDDSLESAKRLNNLASSDLKKIGSAEGLAEEMWRDYQQRKLEWLRNAPIEDEFVGGSPHWDTLSKRG